MLLWQPKSVRKWTAEWSVPIALSCGIHILCLLWLLLHRQAGTVFELCMSRPGARRRGARVAWVVSDAPKKAPAKKAAPTKAVQVKKEPVKTVKKEVAKPVEKKAEPKPVQKEAAQKAVEKQEPVEMTVGGVQAMPGSGVRYTQLQEAIAPYWAPPLGINENALCKVSAVIDAHGHAIDAAIVMASGVLVYDIAARAALLAATMPRWAQGNTIVITFRQ